MAECKFRDHSASFIPHIISSNHQALENLITKPAVEVALIHRLGIKARMYGQEVDSGGNPIDPREASKMDAEVVVRMYRDWVIPLTRDVEVGVDLYSFW